MAAVEQISEEQTISNICELINGSTLLKAGRSGKPHFRQFRLSEDLTRLMWESAKKSDAAVLVSEITELKLGQVTSIFQKNPLPQMEAVSFSLLYSDRSLDIVCKDRKEFETWTTALKALMDGFDKKEEVEKRLKEINVRTAQDKIQVQVGTIKTKVFLKESNCDLYMWGGGARGKLGHKEDDSEPLPRVLASFLGHNITMIACGNSHTMAINGVGCVYAWGAGDYGKLGHGNLRDRYSPIMIDTPLRGVEVVHIACGEHHSAALSGDGKLYTWGKGGPFLGHKKGNGWTNEVHPRIVEPLESENITLVSCGRAHTLALSESGVVFSFGQNKYGELGLGHEREVSIPTIIPNLLHISKIACGRYHSAAVSEDSGCLYMWGCGANGQLGLGELKSMFSPVAITDAFNDHPIDDVSCGYGHTGAITVGGQAYCWGENGSGQCGVPSQAYSEVQKPRPILISSASRPTQISCGYNFTSLLTNSGQLFTWGGGQSGQLGHGDSRKTSSQPIQVDILNEKRVQMVACGDDHMGCLVLHGWVPDDEARACMACKAAFTTIRRRHHCRNCGGVFCGSCSSKKYPLLDKGYSDPVRVCDRCYVTLSAATP